MKIVLTEKVKRVIRLVERNTLSVFLAEEEGKQYINPPKYKELGAPLTRRGVVFASYHNEFGVHAKRAVCQAVDGINDYELTKLVNFMGESFSNKNHERMVKDWNRGQPIAYLKSEDYGGRLAKT